MTARFAHVSVVARDWRKLVTFYQRVFCCTPMPTERDLAGPWLERATGVPDARILGIHLRLPGYGEAGPTLEVFQYNHLAEAQPPAANRPGLAHLAFAVEDVEATRLAVLAAGGGQIGEIVTVEVPDVGTITFAYLTDPEGNLIEVQRWS